jgi:two-component system sensor histidine kinase KdpD
MAASLRADWVVVTVETPVRPIKNAEDRERLVAHLRMAEQLGAETAVLSGLDGIEEIVAYARKRNVTKIVVGKTDEPRWKTRLFGSFLEELLRRTGEIDVYVIRGEPEREVERTRSRPRETSYPVLARSLAVVGVCSLSAWAMWRLGLSETNLAMIYLLGVVAASVRWGRLAGVVTSIVSVLAFNFFFIPPRLTFAVADVQYLLTLGVMLGVAVIVSSLTARIREQVTYSRQRERRTESLYRMSRQLAGVAGSDFLLSTAARQLVDIFGGEVVFDLPDDVGKLHIRLGQNTSIAANPNHLGVAQWVFAHDQPAGIGTDTLPDAGATYLPLSGAAGCLGVLAILPTDRTRLVTPDERRLLDACASQIALALERDLLTLAATQGRLQVETERMRSSLLSSVSHDLRTPLATITGASSMLLDSAESLDHSTRRELLQSICDESRRLARLVENLLEMTRIEAGDIVVRKQWVVLEEVVGTALARVRAV